MAEGDEADAQEDVAADLVEEGEVAPGGDDAPATPPSVAGSQAEIAKQPRAPPFGPPDSVRQWLRDEDWEPLRRAWNDAEAKATSWAEGDVDDLDPGMFEDGGSSSASSPSKAGHGRHKRRDKGLGGASTDSVQSGGSRRPKLWNENFTQIGNDSRYPAPLRRYFDSVPAETSPPRTVARRSLEALPQQQSKLSDQTSRSTTSPKARQEWNEQWGSLASRDNDGIHPHLRHYFDRRGMEASFRMRPHTDSPWLQQIRPRTPERPTAMDLLLKHSVSAPSVGTAATGSVSGSDSISSLRSGTSRRVADPLDVKERGKGDIRWGTRCMVFGNEARTSKKQKIPWVYDHDKVEAEDNVIVHPLLRHYFDSDGLESSFRNRGRHYGRPTKVVFGVGGSQKPSSTYSGSRSRQSLN